jgi:hypothetical protein
MPEELRILPTSRQAGVCRHFAPGRLYGQMRRQRYLDNRKVLFGGLCKESRRIPTIHGAAKASPCAISDGFGHNILRILGGYLCQKAELIPQIPSLVAANGGKKLGCFGNVGQHCEQFGHLDRKN